MSAETLQPEEKRPKKQRLGYFIEILLDTGGEVPARLPIRALTAVERKFQL